MNKQTPLPTGDEKARAVRSMFDTIAARYDLVNRVMTFGLDVGWRRRVVDSLGLGPGARVLDMACGTGDLCRELARGGYRPVGADFALEMLHAARTTAPLIQADILHLPLADASVDGATCGFALRNVVDLPTLFAETARVVRPGGRIGLLEVAEPQSKVVRAGHGFYFNKVVPMVGGLISDRTAYSYLPRSVAYLPDPDALVQMIVDAGFDDVDRRLVRTGAAQIITATRR